MIKVLQIVSSVGTPGGVQQVLWNYYSHMDEQDIRFDFVNFTEDMSGFEKNFTNKDSKIYFATPRRKSIFRNIRDIDKAIKSDKYDVVHVHQDYLGYIGLMVAWWNGIKVRICHSHKANLKENFIGKLKHMFFGTITRMFATDLWGCGRDAIKWTYGERVYGREGVVPLKNAIKTQHYEYDEETRKRVRAEFNIDEDCVLIGNVARYTYQKNHEFLIEIFDEICKMNKNYKLMLVGDGELFESVMKLIEGKGLSDKVLALGNRNDVNELMQGFDIFLLPSKWEGLGVVLVEAQCSGLKCIASDVVPDETDIIGVKYISLSKSAKDWADEIMKTEISERRNMTDIVRENGFDIEEEAKKLTALYHSLTGK